MRGFFASSTCSGEPADGERDAAIFCRNVMTYFDKPTERPILEPRAVRV